MSDTQSVLARWIRKYYLALGVLLTIAIWSAISIAYGYMYIERVLLTEPLYGYERSRLLIASAFVVYRVPYLLIALAIVIVLELAAALHLEQKSMMSVAGKM